MNALARCACIGLAALLLPACSSMQERETFVPDPRPPSLMDPDATYIATVERIARRRGIHVTWVNAPTRRPQAVDGTPR